MTESVVWYLLLSCLEIAGLQAYEAHQNHADINPSQGAVIRSSLLNSFGPMLCFDHSSATCLSPFGLAETPVKNNA